MTVINLFSGFAPAPTAELVDVLIQTGRCRLEHIVSTGHATSPSEWYDQDTNEWVALLRGSAGLRFEDNDAVVVGSASVKYASAVRAIAGSATRARPIRSDSPPSRARQTMSQIE